MYTDYDFDILFFWATVRTNKTNSTSFPALLTKLATSPTVPKWLFNYVPVTKVLNVPVSVYETVQESHLGRVLMCFEQPL